MENYRAVFIPAIEKSTSDSFSVPAKHVEEAQKILNAIADYTLYLHDKKLMNDYSNFGVIEQFVDGEWESVDEDEQF